MPNATQHGLCRNGLHEWTPENTYVSPNGTRTCRECARATERRRAERDREKRNTASNARYHAKTEAQRRGDRLSRHGMTQEQYDTLLAEQGGGCAACGTTEPGGKWNTYFAVDHDHACCSGPNSCGECVRGLLCGSCNVALGNVHDDPDVLIALAAYVIQRSVT